MNATGLSGERNVSGSKESLQTKKTRGETCSKPSPSLIGHQSEFELQILASDCETDENFSIPPESREEYQSERQWFFMNVRHRATSGELDTLMDVARQSSPTRTKQLNEHGLDSDPTTYRMRREWYMQNSLMKLQANDLLIYDGSCPSSGGACNDSSSRQAWMVLLRACCIMVLALSVWFSSNAFLSEICNDYGISKSHGNLLTVSVNVGFTLGATAFAIMQVPDRFPPAKLLPIGALSCAASNALLVLQLNFNVLIMARLVNGVALSLVYPILMRYVSSWFPPAKKGLTLGILLGSLTLGIALPSLIKALLPDVSWQAVILSASVLPVFACILSCGAQSGPHVSQVPAFSIANVKGVMCNMNWGFITFSYIAHSLELWGGWAFMGAFLEDRIVISESLASFLSFGVLAFGVVGSIFGGVMADRIGKKAVIASCHIISGVSLASLPSLSQIATPPVVFAVAGIWGSAVIADSAQYSALLAEVLLDKRLLGTALALKMGIGFTSTALGIYIVPLLVEWGGWDKAFPCLSLGAAVGFLVILPVKGSNQTPQRISRMM